LLVILHTWSGDYKQDLHQECMDWCLEKGWAFIHPNFRGPNKRPEATGSEFVIKDILSAVDYAQTTARIDPSRIYLVGTSGGGYTALLIAGRAPDIWAGISAWVPIVDLRSWYFDTQRIGREYYKDIVASCGGPPGSSPAVDEEYRKRSPITYLANATGVMLDINAGIQDGHTGSVPISHSLRAFNAVASPKDQIPDSDIEEMAELGQVPDRLASAIEDPTYGDRKPLFRRSSGKVRVTLFQGGHELVSTAAMSWLEKQRKVKR
jgi:acetyl esterase/lipase